jgi:hypothetical protein
LLEGFELEIDTFAGDLKSSNHHVVLMGDLNFRCDLPAAVALRHLADGELAPLLATCELGEAMRKGEARSMAAMMEPHCLGPLLFRGLTIPGP